jgi:hypothetical protein
MIKIQLASDLHLEFLQRGYPGEKFEFDNQAVDPTLPLELAS